ncbi:MAG: glycosyltransferase family 2 protein [Syntrophorhabdales bacterium]|jgi:GT2 family glycosyltransferase
MGVSISVIVLNWNGGAYLASCLDSLAIQDCGDLEIIVVDNASTDDSVDMIRGRYRSVRLIENKENVGFAAGNNVGIRQAKGDYVVILNNDAELEADCLSKMRRALEKDGRYGACAARIYLKFEEGILDAAGIAICPDGLSIGRGRLERGERYNREEEVFFGSGCCIMCRREMLEDVKVGDDYFDEAFFMYADDTDLGWRAALRGWRCVYAPDALAYHLHSASLENYSPLKAFLVERNRIWLQVKYFPFRMMLRGQFFTAFRYLFQAYGAVAGRGASGSFSKEHSKGELVTILFRVWASALRGLPAAWKKRRIIQKRRTISTAEIRNLVKAYGIRAREIALKA